MLNLAAAAKKCIESLFVQSILLIILKKQSLTEVIHQLNLCDFCNYVNVNPINNFFTAAPSLSFFTLILLRLQT